MIICVMQVVPSKRIQNIQIKEGTSIRPSLDWHLDVSTVPATLLFKVAFTIFQNYQAKNLPVKAQRSLSNLK